MGDGAGQRHLGTILAALLGAVVGGVVVGLGLGARPETADPFDPTVGERLVRLEERVGELDGVRTLDGAPEPAIDLRLDDVLARLERLEDSAGAAPVAADTPAGRETPDAAADKALETLLAMLGEQDTDRAFTATIELARLGDLRAVQPLVGAMRSHKDFYVRLGAATALGSLKALDGVPALIDALDDKDELVRTAASEGLMGATGHAQIAFHAGARRTERLVVIETWRTWWRDNERQVRADRK